MPCVTHATYGLRARGGSKSLYGSAWFGSVWVGILGGILFWVGLRARDLPTERVLSEILYRTPLIIRTVDHFFQNLNQITKLLKGFS